MRNSPPMRHRGRWDEPVAATSNDAPIEVLLAATAAEDRAAFAILYGRTSPVLYAIVRRILREGQDADDVLQDVFIRIWHGAGSYDASRGKPMTWLITVARNRAIDVLRSRGKGQPVGVAPDSLTVMAADAVDAHELAALRGCLDELDVQHRDCIVQAYCYGSSRDELAARFGRPVNTVKSWLSRGLLSLKRCLGDG